MQDKLQYVCMAQRWCR